MMLLKYITLLLFLIALSATTPTNTLPTLTSTTTTSASQTPTVTENSYFRWSMCVPSKECNDPLDIVIGVIIFLVLSVGSTTFMVCSVLYRCEERRARLRARSED
ncbi:uncharacterized protein LY89DRAFT_671807 [Mollisia scopiformis]|uniref:Uncharacterized protein n=1 Tax=Mollisia scopiformis TaxID=149040 RepID=A0A194X2Q7_MOLSC|nr:uncharacterized protein LY89DRAFT_671807 [Mollisia scopiformis]KUJ14465.1 hypothetical protein LY89DRAFT_671807 [Mollisia scopiformis]